MQAHYKASELFTVVGQGATQKECFKDLADGVEPFRVSECGVCKGKNIFPRVRTVGKFTYYEMACSNNKCWAKLSYGQSTENGALYPRKKYHENHPKVKSGEVEVGDYIPNNGWEVYVRGEETEVGEPEEVVKPVAKSKVRR